jgi:hypothetical protein
MIFMEPNITDELVVIDDLRIIEGVLTDVEDEFTGGRGENDAQ